MNRFCYAGEINVIYIKKFIRKYTVEHRLLHEMSRVRANTEVRTRNHALQLQTKSSISTDW